LQGKFASFPIPVITGIGHATNETVVEMISFSNAITPTKIAEFLIRKFNEFYETCTDAEDIIIRYSTEILLQTKIYFSIRD
jgi:exodeoxyribonuclease VII large subunit